MTNTIRPRGAIADSTVAFLTTFNGKFSAIDEASNQWEIGDYEFKRLSSKGFIVKEVRIK